VTFAVCGALYYAADWRAVARTLGELDVRWFAAAMLLFVPQTIVSARRWGGLARPNVALSLGTAIRHTLAASTLNLVVPSKLGDFSKAAFIRTASVLQQARLARCVGYEKIADLAALLVLTLLCLRGSSVDAAAVLVAVGGLVFVIRRAWPGSGEFLAATALLWTLHLAQVHCFVLAAGVEVPWTTTFARAPLALLAGVVPAAFCGIGTRDAALVWLFADVAPASAMAVVGLLTALRYLVPGLAGLPLWWRLQREAAATIRPAPPTAIVERRFPLDPIDTRPNPSPTLRVFDPAAKP
jgi:uncharacterized membrane protein YbhN (UPF0104 family)